MPTAHQTRFTAWRGLAPAVLGIGILAVSTASILIRLAGAEASPLAIGAWRLSLAALFLAPFALPRAHRTWQTLEKREVLALLAAGVALALHFATWVYSLTFTSVASSVFLVTTNPIFVGLASHFILHERVRGIMVLAILITIAGGVIISYGDLSLSGSGRALLGNGLALLGALAASAYILLGRVVRRRLSTLDYVWPCYGLAGLLLLGLCILTRQPLWGYTPRTVMFLVLLAVIPQILGHSAFNWALGHVSPLLVTIALLGEPIGATLLAFLILGEAPSATAFVGGPLILIGILMASMAEGRSVDANPQAPLED